MIAGVYDKCKRGHEFTEENTYVPKSGKRNCRLCCSIRIKNYRQTSKGFKNLKESWRRHNKKYPWMVHYRNARARTIYPKSRYYQRGIKLLMEANDFKELWFRDKAYLLKKPSIDRIDTSLHYSFPNCRFIELTTNLKRPRTKS
jgi:hypothetical protein